MQDKKQQNREEFLKRLHEAADVELACGGIVSGCPTKLPPPYCYEEPEELRSEETLRQLLKDKVKQFERETKSHLEQRKNQTAVFHVSPLEK